ncbi:MAG: hypothetical protein ACREA2_06615 [Blastocatellia bacterium]
MLKENYDFTPTPLDLIIFEKLVPPDHYLRQLKAAINFTPMRALVAQCYSSEMGRGAIDPVLLLKLHLQLLAAAECFAPAEVSAQQQRALEIRQNTADLKDEARLLRRVEHLRELTTWGDAWLLRLAEACPPLASQAQQQAFRSVHTQRSGR